MILALKHWFLPHSGNGHQPHVLRVPVLAAIALSMLIAQVGYNFQVTGGQIKVLGYATNVLHAELISRTNQERSLAGLHNLREDEKLNEAARLKAEDMLRDDYWNHIAPDGTEPWHFFKEAGYEYVFAGENLARDFNTSAGVVKGWMESAGHRANVLNENYRDIGIAVKDGVLLGEETTLVVAMYGSPSDETVSSVDRASPILSADGTVESAERAPTTHTYRAADSVYFGSTLGWGHLITAGTLVSLLPAYAATHIAMIRNKLHKAKRWLWRRRLLELVFIVALLALVLSSGIGSVG